MMRLQYIPTQRQIQTIRHKDTEGFVYVLQGEGGFFKIGLTQRDDVQSRYREITAALPWKITLLFAYKVSNAFRIEALLHRKYTAKWVRGEWFSLDVDDLGIVEGFLQQIAIEPVNRTKQTT